MKRFLCFVAALGLCGSLPAQVERDKSPAKTEPAVVPHWLWAGSWESRKNLTNRAQLSLAVPAAGLTFRIQGIDRRPAGSWDLLRDSFAAGAEPAPVTDLSGGVYHGSSGSRLLYGKLDIFGLPARIRSPWIRGMPYEEGRAAAGAELKTDPAVTGIPSLYLYLKTPPGKKDAPDSKYRFFTSFSWDEEESPALMFGTEWTFAGSGLFRLESYYTERTLPPRSSASWFNEKPALPERDFRLFAGSFLLETKNAGVAADLACSETFAFGRDFYGSLGLRLGSRPWRLSLALDGGGSRFVGSSGTAVGSGFRTAARVERRGRGTSLFRVEALFRGPGPDVFFPTGDEHPGPVFSGYLESFNRSALSLYYRPPVSKSPCSVSRLSLSFSRDSRESGKDLDTVEAQAGFFLGPVSSVSAAALGLARPAGGGPDEYSFASAKLSETLSWQLGKLHCTAKMGYAASSGKVSRWNISLGISARWKNAFVSAKIALPEILEGTPPETPQNWNYTLSWTLKK